MKILITGGAGFIGSNLALKLIDRGHEITILDSLSKQIHGDIDKSPLYLSIKDKCCFIKDDVVNKIAWKAAIKSNDVIVHLAAETGTGQSMYEISKYVKTNSVGTANMLDVLVNEKHNVTKVILASSRAIYGEGKYFCEKHGVVYPKARNVDLMKIGDFKCKCPMCNNSLTVNATDEISTIHPSSVYGITKYNQEQLVKSVCESIGISAIAFRYQNVYGPGQSLTNPYTGILSIFSNLILTNNQINIFEDGKESRDFVYIDDVIKATIKGIEHKEKIVESFNVGTGVSVTVLNVAKYLFKQYKQENNLNISGSFRIGDIRHNYADISYIKHILDYVPEYSFQKGIEKFANWVLQQKLSDSKYAQSEQELIKRNLFVK